MVRVDSDPQADLFAFDVETKDIDLHERYAGTQYTSDAGGSLGKGRDMNPAGSDELARQAMLSQGQVAGFDLEPVAVALGEWSTFQWDCAADDPQVIEASRGAVGEDRAVLRFPVNDTLPLSLRWERPLRSTMWLLEVEPFNGTTDIDAALPALPARLEVEENPDDPTECFQGGACLKLRAAPGTAWVPLQDLSIEVWRNDQMAAKMALRDGEYKGHVAAIEFYDEDFNDFWSPGDTLMVDLRPNMGAWIQDRWTGSPAYVLAEEGN